MQYAAARDYVRGLIRRGIKYDLAKIQRLTDLLGHPERDVRWIHVTGTTGKGSVCATLEGLMRGAGHKVGLFTSPHLVGIRERFRMDGVEVSEERFAAVVERLKPAIDRMADEPMGPPTFFEICTAFAFCWFQEEAVDVAIAEVGLGGRLDATNVITPEVTVISNVGMDHPKTLGPTLAHICRAKCGIIKRGIPLLCGVDQPDLRAIVEQTCLEREAPLHWFDQVASIGDVTLTEQDGTTFELALHDEQAHYLLSTPLIGPHQAVNAAMALVAARLLPEDLRPAPATWPAGLRHTWWDGRFQILSRNPTVVIDGGHNVEGVETLVRTWRALYGDRRAQLVAGFSGDKTLGSIIEMLRPFADRFIFTKSENYRAAEPEMLAETVRAWPDPPDHVVVPSPAEALAEARRAAGPEGIVLVTGSLYLLGAVLAAERGVTDEAM